MMPSTAVIRPPTTVKAIRATGRPRRVMSMPAAPLTSTGLNSACGLAPATTALDTGGGAAQHRRSERREPVGARRHLGVEQLEEGGQVAVPRGGEERVDHPLLGGDAGVRRACPPP